MTATTPLSPDGGFFVVVLPPAEYADNANYTVTCSLANFSTDTISYLDNYVLSFSVVEPEGRIEPVPFKYSGDVDFTDDSTSIQKKLAAQFGSDIGNGRASDDNIICSYDYNADYKLDQVSIISKTFSSKFREENGLNE